MVEKVRWLFKISAACMLLDGAMLIASSIARLICEADELKGEQYVNMLKVRALFGLILIVWCGFGWLMFQHERSWCISSYSAGLILCVGVEVSLISFLSLEGLELVVSIFFVIMQEVAILTSLWLAKEFRNKQEKLDLNELKELFRDLSELPKEKES